MYSLTEADYNLVVENGRLLGMVEIIDLIKSKQMSVLFRDELLVELFSFFQKRSSEWRKSAQEQGRVSK